MKEDLLTSPQLELGKKAKYDLFYNPEKLFAIPRQDNRVHLNIDGVLPFYGFDLWNHYEVSWLNPKGKPIVAVGNITYSCDTPFIIESKSMKLYFNSFTQSIFKDEEDVRQTIQKDLELRVKGKVNVELMLLQTLSESCVYVNPEGQCLDDLDITCNVYSVDPGILQTEGEWVEELVFTNLFKSNCLVTHQPDWGTIQVGYKGQRINHESLLKYLVSFRNHNDFHEHCVERIFMDLIHFCGPSELSVWGKFTRRGGMDINPFRTTQKDFNTLQNRRLIRQ